MSLHYHRATAPTTLGDQRAARERRLWHYWTTTPATTSGMVTTASSTSGSDCSAGSSPDQLADLVNSFYNGDDYGASVPSTVVAAKSDKDVLEELLAGESEADAEALFLVRRIKREAEAAFQVAVKAVAGRSKNQAWDWGEATTDEVAAIKRKVMWALRQRGFDAGLCKSRPDKEACRFPAGTGHDYIDVLVSDDEGGGGSRYIVELGLGSEFGIARPSESYASLLEVLPRVFVGKPESLKGVVGIMCAAAATSLKSQAMYVAPWRRREYVMSKWFGPYKRSTSRVPSLSSSSPSSSASSTKTKEEEEEPAATVAVVGILAKGGGGHWKGALGCRGEEWERRGVDVVGLAGMYL